MPCLALRLLVDVVPWVAGLPFSCREAGICLLSCSRLCLFAFASGPQPFSLLFSGTLLPALYFSGSVPALPDCAFPPTHRGHGWALASREAGQAGGLGQSPGGGVSRILGWGEAKRVEMVIGRPIHSPLLLRSPPSLPRSGGFGIGRGCSRSGRGPRCLGNLALAWMEGLCPSRAGSSGPGHVTPPSPQDLFRLGL